MDSSLPPPFSCRASAFAVACSGHKVGVCEGNEVKKKCRYETLHYGSHNIIHMYIEQKIFQFTS